MPKDILDKNKSDLRASTSGNSKFKDSLLQLLKVILPSRKVIILATFFYFFGIFLAAGEPYSSITFYFGFLTGNLVVQISPVSPITVDYLRFQFLDYLGTVAGNIFLTNMQIILLCILTGIAIIPVILVGLVSFSGALAYTLVVSMGLKGLILYLGQLHLHLELLAALLAIDAFLVFYFSIFQSLLQVSFQPFKQTFKKEFFPLILKITLIMFLAAFIEVFWSTWFVYVFTHPYIPWTEFYLYLKSCLIV